MDTHNFWYWLINGFTNVLISITSLLPIHAPIGFASFINSFLTTAMVPPLFFVGTFFGLRWFGLIMGAFVLSEIARALVAAWRMILRLVPMAG